MIFLRVNHQAKYGGFSGTPWIPIPRGSKNAPDSDRTTIDSPYPQRCYEQKPFKMLTTLSITHRSSVQDPVNKFPAHY